MHRPDVPEHLLYPKLIYESGIVAFFKGHRECRSCPRCSWTPSPRTSWPPSTSHQDDGLPLAHFEKGQRKDDVAQMHLARFEGNEGVLFVRRAQERTPMFRTQKQRNPLRATYPWLVRDTAMVNHLYWPTRTRVPARDGHPLTGRRQAKIHG